MKKDPSTPLRCAQDDSRNRRAMLGAERGRRNGDDGQRGRPLPTRRLRGTRRATSPGGGGKSRGETNMDAEREDAERCPALRERILRPASRAKPWRRRARPTLPAGDRAPPPALRRRGGACDTGRRTAWSRRPPADSPRWRPRTRGSCGRPPSCPPRRR